MKAGDDLISRSCGPRITWTTALVLEALLKLGCEKSERVQAAMWMLTSSRWCDNAQQHGMSGTGEIRRKDPFSNEEIKKIEQDCIHRYRYGGISSLKELENADMAHTPFHLRRIAYSSKKDEYLLRMPDLGQGCPAIMTRALSQVKNRKLRMLAEANLWKYAGFQHSTDGSFEGRHGLWFTDPQAGLLSIFARYDHPVAKLVIMRSIPWIISNQNKDGSWGKQAYKDISTLAVFEAIVNVRDYLPWLIP